MEFLKKLKEKKVELRAQMDAILSTAEEEERAINEDEQKNFDALEADAKNIDRTIAAYEQRAKELEGEDNDPDNPDGGSENRAEEEERAFADYIRGVVTEERADVNLTFTDNGAIVPASIANKIIEKVKDISPIFALADRYDVNGTLSIPKYDESTQKIEMAYHDEFEELTSTAGKFTSISLTGFLAGALTEISIKLINNTNFDVLGYTIRKMSEAAAEWIEEQMLKGTTGKITGLSDATQVVKTAASTAITADDLIDVQEEVPDRYQSGSIWIMNRKTRKQIRKLKDADGNYILNRDPQAKWGYTLLGNDIYCSDNVDEIAAGKKVVAFGDFSGLALKVSENPTVQVLREKFATKHAIGVMLWLEIDAKIEDEQKIAVLQMKEV